MMMMMIALMTIFEQMVSVIELLYDSKFKDELKKWFRILHYRLIPFFACQKENQQQNIVAEFSPIYSQKPSHQAEKIKKKLHFKTY